MKRGLWVLAIALVVLGFVLLLFAGIGLNTMPMTGMGGMGNMSSMMMPFSMRLMMGVFVAILVIPVILGAAAVLNLWSKARTQRCEHCHRPVQSDWVVCPYCQGPLEKNTLFKR